MPKQKRFTLHDLLILKLKALYDIETQLIKALPKMAKAANNEDLKSGFKEHLEQTKRHVERLEKAFDLLSMKPAKTLVEGIRGIIEDGEWIIKNIKDKNAIDAALIAAAQYAEHYEIAGYGTAAQWAELMGHDEVKNILGETLEEEKMTDEKLSALAKEKINDQANTMYVEE